MRSDKSSMDNRRADEKNREKGYREQALKLYPWICGRCAREFGGKQISELTVHHKDHNHGNNPPDGSNWELLCIYCHDNEHSKYVDQVRYGADSPARGDQRSQMTYKAFASIADLLKKDSG